MDTKQKHAMTFEEFKLFSQPEIWAAFRGTNKTFMDCHQAVFAKTGIWIEELVPVFQKLDANLAR